MCCIYHSMLTFLTHEFPPLLFALSLFQSYFWSSAPVSLCPEYPHINFLVFPVAFSIQNSFCLLSLISSSCGFNPGRQLFSVIDLVFSYMCLRPRAKTISSSNFLYLQHHSYVYLFTEQTPFLDEGEKDQYNIILSLGELVQ